MLHLLGVLAYQVGQNDAAIQQIKSAIACSWAVRLTTTIFGLATAQAPTCRGAGPVMKRRCGSPQYAAAHLNLLSCCSSWAELADWLNSYREAVRLQPDDAAPHA